jgi:hypothetical protein
MEPQIAEFIGHACYVAQHQYKEPIPQGVIEKVIDLTINIFDTDIEFARTVSKQFGHMISLEVPEEGARTRYPFFYEPPPKTLYQLKSKYLDTKTVSGDRQFFATPTFAKDFPFIAQKSATPTYQAIIDELLAIWKTDTGGLNNLVYCTLACAPDGGITQILADAELMLVSLREYVREEFYFEHHHTPITRLNILQRIRAAAAGAKAKIQLLKEGATYQERLAQRRSTYGTRLHLKAKRFAPTSHVWELILWLIARIERFAIATIAIRDEQQEELQMTLMPDQQAPSAEPHAALQLELKRLYTFTHNKIPPGPKDTHSVVSAFEALEQKAEQWIRALGVVNDEAYENFHNWRNDPQITGKPHAVAYDLEGSLQMITAAMATATSTEMEELKQCRADLGAIVRNWAVLFGGKLGHRQGDKDIAFFARPQQALHAMTHALAHIDALRESGKWGYPAYLRAGLGSGNVIVLDDRPQTLELNATFKAIAACADIDRPEASNGCTAVILDDFLTDNAHLEPYRVEGNLKIHDMVAVRMNWQPYFGTVIQPIAATNDDEDAR